LGTSRATLYRHVGNHEQLLALVLAEQTEAAFRYICRQSGIKALEVAERFMHAVVAAQPLRALIERDPVLFIRVVMAPGPVESRACDLLAELLEAELRAGRLLLRAQPRTIARAIVRVGDSFMYSHLLSRREPEIDEAVAVIRLLLEGP
jgi:AcrR family transcriptional regulator